LIKLNLIIISLIENSFEKVKKLPSWPGGVPRTMNEVNRARRGGGIMISTTPSPAFGRQAHSSALSALPHSCHPSWPGGEFFMVHLDLPNNM